MAILLAGATLLMMQLKRHDDNVATAVTTVVVMVVAVSMNATLEAIVEWIDTFLAFLLSQR